MISIVLTITGVVGILEFIIIAGAIGLLSIVLTVKNELVNRQAAFGLLATFWGVPSLLWLARTEITGKNQSQNMFGIFAAMIFVFIMVTVGYLIGEILFRKKLLKLIKKS